MLNSQTKRRPLKDCHTPQLVDLSPTGECGKGREEVLSLRSLSLFLATESFSELLGSQRLSSTTTATSKQHSYSPSCVLGPGEINRNKKWFLPSNECFIQPVKWTCERMVLIKYDDPHRETYKRLWECGWGAFNFAWHMASDSKTVTTELGVDG
jgi:hypothetical protein